MAFESMPDPKLTSKMEPDPSKKKFFWQCCVDPKLFVSAPALAPATAITNENNLLLLKN